MTAAISAEERGGSSGGAGAGTAGAIEFMGVLKVTLEAGRRLGGPGTPPGQQLQSSPHLCVGLGTQVFKTKPGRGDRNTPAFQEVSGASGQAGWQAGLQADSQVLPSSVYVNVNVLAGAEG